MSWFSNQWAKWAGDDDARSASKPIRMIEVIWNRDRLRVVLPRGAPPKLSDLKREVSAITSVPYEQVKLVYSGMIMKDDRATLDRFGLRDGSRVMLIGSKGDAPGQKQSTAEGAREAQEQAARLRKEKEADLSEGGLLKRIQETVDSMHTDLLPDVDRFERSTNALTEGTPSTPNTDGPSPPEAPSEDSRAEQPQPLLAPSQLAFEHRKLSEMLLRSLLALDGVQVNSDTTRAARKAAVKEVQALLDRVDANWTRAKEAGANSKV